MNFYNYCPKFLYTKLNRAKPVNNTIYIVHYIPRHLTLLIIEILLDTLPCMYLMCGFQLNLLSIVIPKNLISDTISNATPSILNNISAFSL